MPDHMHMLLSLSRELAIADALRDIKSLSSGWLHDTFPALRDFAWQDGYGAFSVSYSGLDKVKSYIADQEAHHRAWSFREEFVVLLQKHGVEYDEQYLWA